MHAYRVCSLSAACKRQVLDTLSAVTTKHGAPPSAMAVHALSLVTAAVAAAVAVLYSIMAPDPSIGIRLFLADRYTTGVTRCSNDIYRVKY